VVCLLCSPSQLSCTLLKERSCCLLLVKFLSSKLQAPKRKNLYKRSQRDKTPLELNRVPLFPFESSTGNRLWPKGGSRISGLQVP
jgi:hypothetical protein